MYNTQQYYDLPLAAYVRGCALAGVLALPPALTDGPVEELTQAQLDTLFAAGKAAGLKLYHFKRSHEELPRVRRVLGFLKGIGFDSLLDVGSGRGAFLLPLLAAFPWAEVTSVDILPHRVAFLNRIAAGGIRQLTALEANICDAPLPEKSVDVVTLLEVLEHIPQVELAVQAAVKTARRFVVVSVPSQEDDNPEHIHLLTKQRLTELFHQAGCRKLRFDGVNGHLILIANTEDMPHA